jgi:hypothetical protein
MNVIPAEVPILFNPTVALTTGTQDWQMNMLLTQFQNEKKTRNQIGKDV